MLIPLSLDQKVKLANQVVDVTVPPRTAVRGDFKEIKTDEFYER